MHRYNSTDFVVPGPVQSGLYRQVVLLLVVFLTGFTVHATVQ